MEIKRLLLAVLVAVALPNIFFLDYASALPFKFGENEKTLYLRCTLRKQRMWRPQDNEPTKYEPVINLIYYQFTLNKKDQTAFYLQEHSEDTKKLDIEIFTKETIKLNLIQEDDEYWKRTKTFTINRTNGEIVRKILWEYKDPSQYDWKFWVKGNCEAFEKDKFKF